jgi:AAA15 family ATPase/GTPase
MFLKYGGRNFYCFKEDFEVDLRLNKNCPQDISQGKDYSNVMCIKGANASGKTNALKALSFICEFVCESFSKKPDKKIEIEAYFNNLKPIFLFCEFRIDFTEYRYELEISNSVVSIEKLIELGSSDSILFSRDLDRVISTDEIFKELGSIPQIRSNASLISISKQHEIKSTESIWSFFYHTVSNVGHHGFKDITDENVHAYYYKHPKILILTKNILIEFDTGLSDVVIESYFDSEGKEVFYPVFIFDIGGENKILRYQHQSSGTKRLYHLLAFCFIVFESSKESSHSYHFIADELDLHLHSKILPEIVKLFEKNENTQLIFTCQNDQIMDSMGKYRTVLINKEENESYAYRLDELSSDLLRNGRPVTPHYANGSLGGVPNLG